MFISRVVGADGSKGVICSETLAEAIDAANQCALVFFQGHLDQVSFTENGVKLPEMWVDIREDGKVIVSRTGGNLLVDLLRNINPDQVAFFREYQDGVNMPPAR